MIEVDDILDELHTLKLVLMDQKNVVQDMNKTLSRLAKDRTMRSYVNTRTLDYHLARIDQMEDTAKKADKSVRFATSRFIEYDMEHFADIDHPEASSPRGPEAETGQPSGGQLCPGGSKGNCPSRQDGRGVHRGYHYLRKSWSRRKVHDPKTDEAISSLCHSLLRFSPLIPTGSPAKRMTRFRLTISWATFVS